MITTEYGPHQKQFFPHDNKSIPLLSQADATPEWAMKKWPFLLQSSPSQIMQMKAIAEIVKSWKLYNITMICEDGDSSSIEVLSQLSGALKEVGTELSNREQAKQMGCSFSDLNALYDFVNN
ncbi:hypothetical protein JHK85_016640 [Glycine max]|nr:hypothetical protein JHK85_016640 [Glycine max]